MAGGTPDHNEITTNLVVALKRREKGNHIGLLVRISGFGFRSLIIILTRM